MIRLLLSSIHLPSTLLMLLNTSVSHHKKQKQYFQVCSGELITDTLTLKPSVNLCEYVCVRACVHVLCVCTLQTSPSKSFQVPPPAVKA